MAPYSSTLAWKSPWMEEPGTVHGVAKSRTRLRDFTFTFHFHALEKEMDRYIQSFSRIHFALHFILYSKHPLCFWEVYSLNHISNMDFLFSRSVVPDSFCDYMDCSPPGSSVHGILQARILEWVVISFSRASSQPRDQTWVSCTNTQILHCWAAREAPIWASMSQLM